MLFIFIEISSATTVMGYYGSFDFVKASDKPTPKNIVPSTVLTQQCTVKTNHPIPSEFGYFTSKSF